ncbi:hypothetical protein F5J12DRAFT_846744 [Pisolithus orientalis]|uniref:uncharacterized protein n=1 Tax=Pisolithus orientalis TaxID=936130 RepID=UPI00222503AA|nr:uncharacterized protein F5J12DRAFT_846744 [Pisolithus orientalis]KAI5999801.1 hypothetical protein F5J12DRAFT_846744 [Pisolithus orientalis]
MANEPTQILNPVVYLNYLSPDDASTYEFSRNLNLATLAVLLWDILSSVPDDYKLMQTGRVSIILFTYFLARLSALGLDVIAVLQKTGPVSNCTLSAMLLMAFQVVSSAAAAYLFLKRVHAVYFGNKVVRHFFSFLWIVGVGTSCATFQDAMDDQHEIADTKHCIRYQSQTPVSVAFMGPVLFDTLVYLAIAYKILTSYRMLGWKALLCGSGLPDFSRAVFQGGQQYYLVTAGVNMTRLAFALLPSVSPSFAVMVSAFSVTLTSIMACRVHRNLIIKDLAEAQTNGAELTTAVLGNGSLMNVVPLPGKATALVRSGVQSGSTIDDIA